MGAATPFTALTAERWLRMLALSAALCLGPAIAAANGVGNAPASQRFTLNAQLSPSNVSDDGRYVIHANMRPTPQPVANAGRFALNARLLPDTKSTGTQPFGTPCGPLGDALFANGFEN